MASQALASLEQGRDRASLVVDIAQGVPERIKKDALYGASLVLVVSAWEAFLEELVRDFFRSSRDLMDSKYSYVHYIAERQATERVEKFHNPSAENARELLFKTTGYDPVNDWRWPSAGLDGPGVRAYLNEVVEVRHAVAHGAELPTFGWTTSQCGRRRLTSDACRRASRLVEVLARQTTRGTALHMQAVLALAPDW